MKFIVLAIGIIGIIPLALVLRANAYTLNKFWIFIGLAPFISSVTPLANVALITWDQIWFSYVPGLQVTIIDLIAVAIYCALWDRKNSIRFHIPFILYLIAITQSAFHADKPLAALFYVWQFVRIYFFVTVIAKACTTPEVPTQLLKGMALGLLVQLSVTLWQKFGLHVLEPSGTFPHRNTLGLVLHLVVSPHFALFLAGQRQLQNAATPLLGLTIASIIASRAAVGIIGFNLAVTYMLSCLRERTRWKAMIGLAGVLVVAVMAPIAYQTLEKRFERDPLMEHEYDERAAFNRAALLMLDDHPFGVGVNHYSYVGKNYGYSIRAGVYPNEANLNNTVHNAYMLAAAEAGYLGFISFIILCACPLWIALKYVWKSQRNDPRGDLLLGLATGFLATYIHSYFEYVIVMKDVQYILGIAMGMTFGLAHQIKVSGERQRAIAPKPVLPPPPLKLTTTLRQRRL